MRPDDLGERAPAAAGPPAATHRSSTSWRKAPRPDARGFAASLGVQQTFFTAAAPKDLLLTRPIVFCFVLFAWRVSAWGGGRVRRFQAISCEVKAHMRDVWASSVSTEFAARPGSSDVISSSDKKKSACCAGNRLVDGEGGGRLSNRSDTTV